MTGYFIRGGHRLKGVVDACGAKNAALALLSAAVLTSEPVIIDNLPDVSDINLMIEAIGAIGAKIERINRHKVRITGATIDTHILNYSYISKIRASYYMLGALLGRFKDASVAMPGGCVIGARPIDMHIKGFEALGATVKVKNGIIKATAEELFGAHIYFDKVSVGATVNVMLASVMAKGSTTIENAAKEPHVVDLANMLNSMGANIRGAGTDVIRIRGVERLHKTEYTVIPDQIEIGTYMFAAAVTGGDVVIRRVIPRHLESISAKLRDMGCTVEEYDEAVRVKAPEKLKNTHVMTMPYPGFPTDMQPQIVTALAVSSGMSTVTEGIFENRFRYTDELARMGAKIRIENNTAIVIGVNSLSGAEVNVPDLRAGAALVIAGLVANGETLIRNVKYIERGYENFDEKLKSLGADIRRVDISDEDEESESAAG